MTALVGRRVKRTFSGFGAEFAGLSRQSTLKAHGEDFGNLDQPYIGGL
jgi:hypothetical protein